MLTIKFVKILLLHIGKVCPNAIWCTECTFSIQHKATTNYDIHTPHLIYSHYILISYK